MDHVPASRPVLPYATDRHGVLDYPRMRRVYEFSNTEPATAGVGSQAIPMAYFPSVWVDAI